MLFEQLHLDVYQLIFDYLSQQDLLNLLLLNHTFYQQIMKYIPAKLLKIDYNCNTMYCGKQNMIISIKQISAVDPQTMLFPDDIMFGACQSGHIKLIQWLISKKIAEEFNTGLYWSCYCGQLDCAKLMIEHGANEFESGLHYACSHNNFSCIKLMIEKGATRCYCNKSIEEHLIQK